MKRIKNLKKIEYYFGTVDTFLIKSQSSGPSSYRTIAVWDYRCVGPTWRSETAAFRTRQSSCSSLRSACVHTPPHNSACVHTNPHNSACVHTHPHNSACVHTQLWLCAYKPTQLWLCAHKPTQLWLSEVTCHPHCVCIWSSKWRSRQGRVGASVQVKRVKFNSSSWLFTCSLKLVCVFLYNL